jgi:small conductance mechanosensitive channel
MKKNRKALLAIEISVLALILATFIFCLVAQLTNPEAPYAVWVKENIWDVQGTIASLKAHVPTLIKSLITIVIIYAVCRILRMIFNAKMKKNNRTKTVFDLLDGFVKYGCAIAIILTVLKACGVDTTALIASVGVLTLVVGLGAQPLIEDIIAGIFIIFENEYNVGEIISINDFRGTVIEIGIRSTKLLDAAGNIKIINNSTIGDVVNLSRENSLAVVDCDFPYDVPLEVLENALEKNFGKIKESIPAIIEGPFYKGVCAYKDSNVTVKIVAKCKEEDRFQVERDLNREYRKIITALGIDIAYPQVVLNYPAEKQDYNPSKKKAEKFVDKQEELSRGLEEQQQ